MGTKNPRLTMIQNDPEMIYLEPVMLSKMEDDDNP